MWRGRGSRPGNLGLAASLLRWHPQTLSPQQLLGPLQTVLHAPRQLSEGARCCCGEKWPREGSGLTRIPTRPARATSATNGKLLLRDQMTQGRNSPLVRATQPLAARDPARGPGSCAGLSGAEGRARKTGSRFRGNSEHPLTPPVTVPVGDNTGHGQGPRCPQAEKADTGLSQGGGGLGSGDPSGTGRRPLALTVCTTRDQGKGISCLGVKPHVRGGSALPPWLLETRGGLTFWKNKSLNHWANWLLTAPGRSGGAVCR